MAHFMSHPSPDVPIDFDKSLSEAVSVGTASVGHMIDRRNSQLLITTYKL